MRGNAQFFPSVLARVVSSMQPKIYPCIEANSSIGCCILQCLHFSFFVFADMEPKVEVLVSEQLTTGDSSISPGDANTPAKDEQFTPVLLDENAAIGGAPKNYKAEMQHLMGSQIDQAEFSPDIGM